MSAGTTSFLQHTWPSPPDGDERVAWLQLIRSKKVGPRTFWGLIDKYGSASEALVALPALASRTGSSSITLASKAEAERELARIDNYGAQLVAIGDDTYPPLLAQIEGPPPLLTILGDGAVAGPRTVGIVGARNASAAGRKMAALMAEGLGQHGVTVASGLARGVDTHAHRASLTTGTMAVMAGGINRIYPRENGDLYRQISDNGAVVSEMPFDAEPVARLFPRRNRLISGMSIGIVVIEAAARSGSLITARFALEQGREVFAVPGSPLDQRAQGTNGLLQNGATLVQTPEDVLEGIDLQVSEGPGRLFGHVSPTPAIQHSPGADAAGSDANRIVGDLLSPSPVGLDELAQISGLNASTVAAAVLELEISGMALRHPGGKVSRA